MPEVYFRTVLVAGTAVFTLVGAKTICRGVFALSTLLCPVLSKKSAHLTRVFGRLIIPSDTGGYPVVAADVGDFIPFNS